MVLKPSCWTGRHHHPGCATVIASSPTRSLEQRSANRDIRGRCAQILTPNFKLSVVFHGLHLLTVVTGGWIWCKFNFGQVASTGQQDQSIPTQLSTAKVEEVAGSQALTWLMEMLGFSLSSPACSASARCVGKTGVEVPSAPSQPATSLADAQVEVKTGATQVHPSVGLKQAVLCFLLQGSGLSTFAYVFWNWVKELSASPPEQADEQADITIVVPPLLPAAPHVLLSAEFQEVGVRRRSSCVDDPEEAYWPIQLGPKHLNWTRLCCGGWSCRNVDMAQVPDSAGQQLAASTSDSADAVPEEMEPSQDSQDGFAFRQNWPCLKDPHLGTWHRGPPPRNVAPRPSKLHS